MEQRPHPIYILYDAKKWIPLLLIPVLRALFAPRDAIYILFSSLRDTGLAALLIAYSIAKWRTARYRLHSGLSLKQGIVVHRTLRVASGEAASIEMERTPLMALTGGRRIRVNTAGLRRRADATLYLSTGDARGLLHMDGKRREGTYRAHIWPVVMMAASSSNAALGLLTLAPAVRQAGEILGRELPNKVYGMVGRLMSIGLPPALESIANILVLGWGLAFLRSLLRYLRFHARRKGGQLHLVSGLFTRRDVLIDSQRITTLEFRQTLFMRLFQLYTATITAAGYGREKGARPVVVPAARLKELCNALDFLIPDYPICTGSLRPKRSSLFRYISSPLWLTVGAFLPFRLGGVWNMAGLIWLIGGIWWLAIRFLAYQRAGFGVGRGAVVMRYSRGLALYEVHVPVEVADCIILTRSVWQRRSGTCNIELRCFGEKRRRHRVFALPYEQAQALIDRLLSLQETQSR